MMISSLYIDKKNNNIIMNVEYVNIEECDIKIRMYSKQVSQIVFFSKKKKENISFIISLDVKEYGITNEQ